MSKKADVAIKIFQSAITKAREKAPEMKGRLLENVDTGAYFTWTPELSIQSHMILVSVEDQKRINAKRKDESKQTGVRGPGANYVQERPDDDYDDMSLEELQEVADEMGVAVGTMKDPEKIKAKLRKAA